MRGVGHMLGRIVRCGAPHGIVFGAAGCAVVCVSQLDGSSRARHNGNERGRLPARQRPPFCAKVGLGKAREELGAIAGIVEWARAGCWLRASLG